MAVVRKRGGCADHSGVLLMSACEKCGHEEYESTFDRDTREARKAFWVAFWVLLTVYLALT